jgi:hypothetical protein
MATLREHPATSYGHSFTVCSGANTKGKGIFSARSHFFYPRAILR